MKGSLLLSDGMLLDGMIEGPQRTAFGWLVANTAVVGFQEMATDPAYKAQILAFTYPEIGNVGVGRQFDESARMQVSGIVTKVLSEYGSHYLSERSFRDMLEAHGVPCLSGIDTRGLAVHLRDNGEMPAAILPEGSDPDAAAEKLRAMGRPEFEPSPASSSPDSGSGPTVAVINLGIRNSELRQLASCCKPTVFEWNAEADEVVCSGGVGVLVSDGPGAAVPPAETVETIRRLLGTVPVLGCGLGHVALGMALGCKAAFLKRGHHGANYPVRCVSDNSAVVTQQRHTVVLDRESVERSPDVDLLWENINDGTVEGIRAKNGVATGIQPVLAAPAPGEVNASLLQFIRGLS